MSKGAAIGPLTAIVVPGIPASNGAAIRIKSPFLRALSHQLHRLKVNEFI